MSNVVGNPEDCFSHNEAHILTGNITSRDITCGDYVCEIDRAHCWPKTSSAVGKPHHANMSM